MPMNGSIIRLAAIASPAMKTLCSRLRRASRPLIYACAAAALASAAWAQQEGLAERTLANGKTAVATYQPGKPGKPAVLLLHGFLQTREFPTVVAMATGLSGAGYTVLAPTLSLGLSRRKASLACEALHTHTMEADVREIGDWVDWLAQQGHRQIALVGHSFGSIGVLAYVANKPHPAVYRAVGVGVLDWQHLPNRAQRSQLLEELPRRIARHDDSIISGALNYCKVYTAPPKAFLSYLRWTRANVLDLMTRSKVPVSVIQGGLDDRMGPDWSDLMARRGAKVQIVPNANHFFDGQSEFDLQDAVLAAVTRPADTQ